MRLYLLHPGWSARSCYVCNRWTHDPSGPNGDAGAIYERGGKRWLKDKKCATQCADCPKIPATAPEKSARYAEQFDDRTWMAFQFYRECRAVKDWPQDPIVRWAAKIIRDVEDEVEERRRNESQATLQAILTLRRA